MHVCMCEMMLKGSKEALTVLVVTHVKRVESGVCGLCTQYRYIQCCVERVKRVKRFCYVHNIDTFNAMSKGLKDYVMLKQGTYTFLLITFLIFNWFSIGKKFWKAETFPIIPPNLMYVKGIESYFDFQPFWHASDIHNIWWYGWKGLSLSFPKLFSDWKSGEH